MLRTFSIPTTLLNWNSGFILSQYAYLSVCVCSKRHGEPGVPHSQKFKGQTSPEFLHGAKALLRNRDKGTIWSLVPLGSQAPAEMKAEKLVENDFLVAASTFNFLNWFSLPAEVRVYRHKTNWFQILIPLTAELSRGLPAIDLQSIQTQLMCWRPMRGGGGGGGPLSS